MQAASVEAEAVEFEEPMSMPDMSMMASACEGRVTRRLSGWRWWEEGKRHDENPGWAWRPVVDSGKFGNTLGPTDGGKRASGRGGKDDQARRFNLTFRAHNRAS